MPTKFFGTPPTVPFAMHAATSDIDDIGGQIVPCIADSALNFGDLVFKTISGRCAKHVNGSWYHARFLGVVVGGDNYGGNVSPNVATDPALIGTAAVSAAGKIALIQTEGVAYVATDASAGAKYYGQQVISGQTTAGRALGIDSNLGSFVNADPGLVISAGGAAVGKVSRTASIFISGVPGTVLTAATNTAALSGTVNNGSFGIYECRSTGAANQTTAFGTAATTLAGVVLPAAPAVGVATYGAIIVNPTGTGNFVGGTTALDDATVVPNAVFMSLIARFPCLGWFLDTTAAAAGTAVRMRIQRE